MGLEMNGLNEAIKALGDISKQIPYTAEKHLRKAGNELKQEAIDATPHGTGRKKAVARLEAKAENAATLSEEKALKKKAKKFGGKDLASGWKGSIKGDWNGEGIRYELKNIRPHYHLIEHGHKMVSHTGKNLGFVQGKHFFEQTFNRYVDSDSFDKAAENIWDEIIKRWEG